MKERIERSFAKAYPSEPFTLEFEVERLTLQRAVDEALFTAANREARIRFLRGFAEHFVIEFQSYLATNRLVEKTITYPTTWWDAFKKRWFPEWAKRRWPYHETTHTINWNYGYPEITAPNALGGRSIQIMRYEESTNASTL